MTFSDKSYFSSLPALVKDTNLIINNKTFLLLNVKKKNKSLVFSIEGIDSIDKAKELVGSDIFIDSSFLPLLDDDTFYEAELIGYKIIDLDNNLYGEIIDVYSLPSNYVFDILLKENNKKVSIPFVKAYFGDSDKINKTIQIIQKPIFDE